MHKHFTRFFALSAIAALTIFAGKTYAETQKQTLFTEKPVEKIEKQALSHAVKISEETPVTASAVITMASENEETPVFNAAAPVAETIQPAQATSTDAGANSVGSAPSSGNAQHFRIKRGAGDDEDDDDGEDGSDDGE